MMMRAVLFNLCTTSFLQYIREWTKKVNRGGLFLIDEAYRLFISLELAMKSKLSTHLPPVLYQLNTQRRRIEQKLSKLLVMMETFYSIGHWQVWIWMGKTKKDYGNLYFSYG